ncbi:MAG: DEAD/DEAH box helicase family protein [Luteolibacter sp.]|uniref:DEAD/DEAH box helicase family protein n=1 Tax=Luteolibacter sp. TaxID=1962973 RepID=UPI0032645593
MPAKKAATKRARKVAADGKPSHKFRHKLLLNQWLISLFGIDPFREPNIPGIAKPLPFHALSSPISDPRMEGLDEDGLHRFYHNLVNSQLFWGEQSIITREQLRSYEENIVRHTRVLNEKRDRPIAWKYYQWLTLIFVEIYLDRFFRNAEQLQTDLNAFVNRFNEHWSNFVNIAPYALDDLNKVCIQNATGSGKTLVMQVNVMQFRHYAGRAGKDLPRTILITPNDRLSEQHIADLRRAGYFVTEGVKPGAQTMLNQIDVIEITKLGDKDGPKTIATRSLGDENLLLVDEGHRGLSGQKAKEEGAFFSRRAALCAKGFTFEYSATFEQAVSGTAHEDDYAKTILFDYSYRWFYEDGFGKDYQILNLPASHQTAESTYLIACLLKFYQKLRIYEERHASFTAFNLEKPLWVFVGSTVSKAKGAGSTSDEKAVAADVARIIQFIADFLAKPEDSARWIERIILGNGQQTGLLDADGNDIFGGSFNYLAEAVKGQTFTELYRDILSRVFHNPAGGLLSLSRVKGDAGEVVLKVGNSEEPFGLINVGDAKGLCDHIEVVAREHDTKLTLDESDFSEAMFAGIKESSSPVNVLIGSKRFVEGWDCWRVSTMGLMHVGKSEGTQIIQLFGRGVRLKGWEWSLKRSGHTYAPHRPQWIEELETLNVFGVEADFMEKFREFLKDEGLPGNERKKTITIPLNVTFDFGKKLKVIRPKLRPDGSREYDFKRDARVPTLGELPGYLATHPIQSDWYPRIQSVSSKNRSNLTDKNRATLDASHRAFLNYDELYFEVEAFKRDKSWFNLNASPSGIRELLAVPDWYDLRLPQTHLTPADFNGIRLLQEVAKELVKRYCDHLYNYRKREYLEPRLEIRDLDRNDDNLPQDEFYQLIVDGDATTVVEAIERLKKDIEDHKDELPSAGDLSACCFGKHLFQPLFHVRKGGKITILPVALNESEYQFVTDLAAWCQTNGERLETEGTEIFLLRNQSRGKGVGFFEAGGFHPDFILWVLTPGHQYVNFVEPHGMLREGPGSEKVQFHQRIKGLEKRLNCTDVSLNSFILSWTRYPELQWGLSREEMEKQHVFFMTDDREHYVGKLLSAIRG